MDVVEGARREKKRIRREENSEDKWRRQLTNVRRGRGRGQEWIVWEMRGAAKEDLGALMGTTKISNS